MTTAGEGGPVGESPRRPGEDDIEYSWWWWSTMEPALRAEESNQHTAQSMPSSKILPSPSTIGAKISLKLPGSPLTQICSKSRLSQVAYCLERPEKAGGHVPGAQGGCLLVVSVCVCVCVCVRAQFAQRISSKKTAENQGTLGYPVFSGPKLQKNQGTLGRA